MCHLSAFGGQEVLAVQIFGPPPIVGGEKMARIASRSAPCPHSLSNPLNTLCMHTNTFSVCTQILSLCMHTNTLVYGTAPNLHPWKSKCAQCRRVRRHSHSNVEPCWVGDEWLRRRVRDPTCQFLFHLRSGFVGFLDFKLHK